MNNGHNDPIIDRIKELANRLDKGHNHTPHHSEHVAEYARAVCRMLHIRGKRKDIIINACLIHDIGKSVIGADIWAKKKRLSEIDWYKIQLHPLISAKIAKEMGCDGKVVELIYYHHVWFNGSGYPRKNGHSLKKGNRIPIGARILAICDAYEAMVSRRAYRDGEPSDEAIGELRKHAAEQFDPRIVEVFINTIIKTADTAG
ncbi:MAG: HD domain-containing protein [Candidatus Omnitrophica bacterium]|nr:HD domain-containing protein [Candidatus Omnitrophota bacterium]